METDNGRQLGQSSGKDESIVRLKEENQKLKAYCIELKNRVTQLENGWIIQRADFLFKIIGSNEFNSEIKQKAMEELSEFLFPVAKEDE